MDIRKLLNEARRVGEAAALAHDFYTGSRAVTALRAEEQYIADAIAAEVARAVAEERERAAQVAETYEAFGCRLPGTTCAGCPADSTWNDGACVAQNIRACVGGKEEER